MKKISLLIPSTLLCLSSVGASAPEAKIDNFWCEPLHLVQKDTNIQFMSVVPVGQKIYLTLSIINDLYPDGINFYSATLSKSGIYKVSYSNEYTRPSGNAIKCGYRSSTSGRIKSFSTDIGVSKGETIIVDTSPYDYVSKSKCANYANQTWDKTSRQMTFYNFNDKYMPNYYHKINFHDFYIINESPFPDNIDFKSANFTISNINGVFDKIASGKTVSLPLVLEKEGKTFYFALQDPLYVNQNTLEMSKTPMDGYVKTKHFYFPRNEKIYEETFECSIVLTDFDVDDNKFVSYFRYKSQLNILGDCRNSEFCIVRGD